MKVPMKWLGRYVDLSGVSPRELADKLTMAGMEVETVEPASSLENVVVGRIDRIRKHPGADALLLCEVDVGTAKKQIVTGASNVAEGDFVPVALDGAKLPEGKVIRTGKLRGEISEGMLCSGPELDVPPGLYPNVGADGILILREAHPLGEDIKATLGIDDTVIDFKITANRPDCQCVLGLAREAAVALGRPYTVPDTVVRAAGEGHPGDFAAVTIDAPDLCTRYVARIVRDVSIAPSPGWMRAALHNAGVRPVNNIVDITNYVMLETGHPMHAFDLRTVRGGTIVVRRAEAGERLTTLDGKELLLDPSVLVIADGRGASALAGIMGGLDSEIRDDTVSVLFEAAHFERSGIRVTARKLGLRSESSARFEKGVSPYTLIDAVDRACALAELLDAGTVLPGAIDVWPEPSRHRPVTAGVRRIAEHLSVPLTPDQMTESLVALGFEASAEGDTLTATAPPWRQDIEGWADLAEEILRVRGYDSVPSTLPRGATLQGNRGGRFAYHEAVKRLMCGMGFMEIETYSFIGQSALDLLGLPADDPLRQAPRLLNPLGEEYALMRTTLVPSMLSVLERNASRGMPRASLFEIGVRFIAEALPLRRLPEERPSMAVGMSDADFFAIKAAIMGLLHAVPGIAWRPGGPAYYHPGRKAEILIGGEHLGWAGEIHPDVADRAGLRGRCAVAEIDLARDLLPGLKQVKPLPRYPVVTRDLALVLDEAVPAGEVMDVIGRAARGLLEDLSLFDVYRGPQVGGGKKSLAFTLVLRDPERTLEDARIQAVMNQVTEACAREAGARVRS